MDIDLPAPLHLNQAPTKDFKEFQAFRGTKSSTGIGRIMGVAYIKVQIDSFKSLSQLAPYLLKLEAEKRLKLIAERIIIKRSIIPYTALVTL